VKAPYSLLPDSLRNQPPSVQSTAPFLPPLVVAPPGPNKWSRRGALGRGREGEHREGTLRAGKRRGSTAREEERGEKGKGARKKSKANKHKNE